MLVVEVDHPMELRYGRGRRADVVPGVYCYVGSALGSGGLAARIRRHHRASKQRHWHVDALLEQARLIGALVIESDERLECRWASWVDRRAPGRVSGFGASDCRCRSHLFRIGGDTAGRAFVDAARLELHARHLSCSDLAALADSDPPRTERSK
jgi:sugar fermentation stimulation protein A